MAAGVRTHLKQLLVQEMLPKFVFIVAMVACAGSAIGAELVPSWSDPHLKFRAGLVLWFDAGRQSAAWQANGKPPLRTGGRVDVCYDGSGNRIDLLQRFQTSQPRFFQLGDAAYLRFDGKDSCLGSTANRRSLQVFTAFVVAAPRSNAGGFRALLAANETGKNDYTTGFTIDFTGERSPQLDRINVEGKGFSGAVNLLSGGFPFGGFHTFEIRAGLDDVQLLLDGISAGRRSRAAGVLSMDDITLGARYFSNSKEPPRLRGFMEGDIAEVLLYDRLLTSLQHQEVMDYLREKRAGLEHLGDMHREPLHLRAVSNPPPIQVLVPGFTVKELPVSLTNINNIRYRPDGKLVALAYDGNIYLLSDSDGDGLEDKVELFWENKGSLRAPVGMAVTPPGYTHGNGVFVAAKGLLALIVDTKKKGKGDKLITVTSGWKEIPHGVDALGVALDKAGNIYFGLGTGDFTNPYEIDKEGKAHYDIKSERGTILKVSPDFSKREIVCTGIRFPVGLSFNRNDDLFATDQEGATWLANGNPLDKLLHIQTGRHYGFPPRHPKHLSSVIDEPSACEFSPQHQSTCGFTFNESVNNGPIFGPAAWASNAFITGYSRGKLYRTELSKTPAGYVARNQVLACLQMLAVDACVSPRGELVVAVHSGSPDWGSGPSGRGKLYKIYYSDPRQPQPVMVWPANIHEMRVAFDRPIEPAQLNDLVRRVTIEGGKYVQPGDRFESLRPGYAAVEEQLVTPRFRLAVVGAQVTGDRRTLVLQTEPHADAVPYAISITDAGLATKSQPLTGTIPRERVIDLAYDLSGVAASWRNSTSETGWEGWLPHPDLAVAHEMTAGSSDHEQLWKLLQQPGHLTLRCQLNLGQMLRPGAQPGSKVDFNLPPEHITVSLESSDPIEVKNGSGVLTQSTSKDGRNIVRIMVSPQEHILVPVEIHVEVSGKNSELHVSYFTAEDSRSRPLPLSRFVLPWVTGSQRSAKALAQRQISELQGGNWERGHQIFFSDQALCSRCHQVGGQGGRIGPDLGNLPARDYGSVMKDISDPSATIHPDHIAYALELHDGRVFTGVPRSERDSVILGDSTGKETRIARDAIELMVPSPISTMPQGLDKVLGQEKMRDLLTFLMTEPLQPAPLEHEGAPAPRHRSQVEAFLKENTRPAPPDRWLEIVLAAGPKDHGPGEHDYPLWQRRWSKLLGMADKVRVSEALGWPSPRQWEKANLIVFYSSNPAWSADKARDLDSFLHRGGGLVFIHYAVDGHAAVETLAGRIGLAWKGNVSRFRHGPQKLAFPDSKHPITRGFKNLILEDESYWNLVGNRKMIDVLATGMEDGTPQPLLWTRQQGKGRVFVSIPGHYTWTFDDPLFRILLLRGMAWAASEPVDRFLSLVTEGARIQGSK